MLRAALSAFVFFYTSKASQLSIKKQAPRAVYHVTGEVLRQAVASQWCEATASSVCVFLDWQGK
jgi:hypothetical protein